ncbi:MAG: M12 family metallo-peptidase [Nannocystaceae bacterium]
MNRKRILAVAKLVLLFGTPVAFVLGLFSGGVYCGVQNRARVASFERDWLGLDVEVPDTPKAEPEATAAPEPKPEPEPEPGDGNDPTPAAAAPEASSSGGSVGATPSPEPAPGPPQPAPAPAAEVPPAAVAGVPAPRPDISAKVDPLDEAGVARLGIPVTVKVQVIVDASFIQSRSDWIDVVQRTVSSASRVYQEQFGITLELWSVGRWDVPDQGMSAAGLLADLQARPRQGANVLLGFTDRSFDGTVADKPVSPAADAPFNSAYGVVYGTTGHRESHLRTLLHELARMMGAKEISNPQDPAWLAGSFMSYAPVPETQALWIDAANRERVLERKDKPFAPAPIAPQ